MTCRNCGKPIDEHVGDELICPSSTYAEADPPQPSLPPSRPGLLYAYFGGDEAQDEETHDHCNAIWSLSGPPWGDWHNAVFRQTVIRRYYDRMDRARQLGVTKAILSADFCLLTENPDGSGFRVNLPAAEQEKRLRELFNGVIWGSSQPTAIYLFDEPDVFGPDAASIQSCCNIVREVLKSYTMRSIPLCTVVSGQALLKPDPWGVRPCDMGGFDDYARLDKVFWDGSYVRLMNELNTGALSMLLPGGSDPWKCPPEKFYEHAQRDNLVGGIFPFQWRPTDPAADPNSGIATNGMADRYKAIGKAIKAANP